MNFCKTKPDVKRAGYLTRDRLILPQSLGGHLPRCFRKRQGDCISDYIGLDLPKLPDWQTMVAVDDSAQSLGSRGHQSRARPNRVAWALT